MDCEANRMKKLYAGFVVAGILAMFLVFSGCVSDQDVDSGTNGGLSDEIVGDNEIEDVNETGFVVFDYPPFDLEKVAYILPLGCMSGSHVTPIDHQYYVSYDFDLGDDAAVDIEVY